MMEVQIQAQDMPLGCDIPLVGGEQSLPAKVSSEKEESSLNETTPVKNLNKDIDSENSPNTPSTQQNSASPNGYTSGSGGSSGKKTRYKGKGLDANGRPRNFYNPPGKVLRSLANQSYYDNFYANQQTLYTLKQKYKTQMCKHFQDTNECSLKQFCQFAHGLKELRQPNDPLPNNFGKTALGAVHSNYKTQPCKNMQKEGECKFGDQCSFYHNEEERRKLIDPLPNLPEGVTLPPMPEKQRSNNKPRYNNNYHGSGSGGKGYYEGSHNISPSHFSPLNNQPPTMIQITSFAEMAAFGGFNPNKYLQSMPNGFQATPQSLSLGLSAYPSSFGNTNIAAQILFAQTQQQQLEMYQQQMMQQMQENNANQQNETKSSNDNKQSGNNNQGHGKHSNKNYNNQGGFNSRSPKKNTQHRYEKKESNGQNTPQKGGKKGDKSTPEQKRYVSKSQKTITPKKVETTTKVTDNAASQ